MLILVNRKPDDSEPCWKPRIIESKNVPSWKGPIQLLAPHRST